LAFYVLPGFFYSWCGLFTQDNLAILNSSTVSTL